MSGTSTPSATAARPTQRHASNDTPPASLALRPAQPAAAANALAPPGVSAPPGLPATPRAAAEGAPGARVILVVEDEASIREMLVRSLGTEYRVYEASDGRTALDVLAATKTPDLIVCDIMMPRMDGLAFAASIKGDPRWKGVPIMFLSGLDAPKDVVNGINAGARHYLTKPFKIQELLAKVAKALGPKR